MRSIVLIAHNLRSTYNVGSLFRTCDGLGVEKLYLTGYTPYPKQFHDSRLPHLADKIDHQISKTALGAEKAIIWKQNDDAMSIIKQLKNDGYLIAAIEQTADSQILSKFKPPPKLALIVGREVEGIEPEILKAANITLEIPMSGAKESFNVTIAAAIALYHCRFLYSGFMIK
jgi:tRNA G18 (ribose-2'-O)-methylase SpoU